MLSQPLHKQICPKCQYLRQQSDSAPQWQCPKCGIAYAKAQNSTHSDVNITKSSVKNRYGGSWIAHRFFTTLVVVSLFVLMAAWWQKDKLPDATEILPDMTNEPTQKKTNKSKFVFPYRGEKYNVVPVADYELWGLVVTHNDIAGWTDIMHDENSVDIKDICVIWGYNTGKNDYQKVSFSSGDFICYFQYPYGVNFAHDQLSNNHLLSDNPFVRMAIRKARIGDQIHLKGILVNYSRKSQPGWWRNTSTTRTDTGNGACEVIFVNEFTILKSSNAQWHSIYSLSKWLLLFTIILKIASYYFLPAAHRQV